jgi:hypothetical protein
VRAQGPRLRGGGGPGGFEVAAAEGALRGRLGGELIRPAAGDGAPFCHGGEGGGAGNGEVGQLRAVLSRLDQDVYLEVVGEAAGLAVSGIGKGLGVEHVDDGLGYRGCHGCPR